MQLTDDDVRAILKLLDASGFGSLELETEQFRLTLQRSDGGGWTQESETLREPQPLPPAAAAVAVPAAPAPPPPHDAAAPGPAASDRGAPALQSAPRPGLIAVTTPLPGTFYRSPKPGSPAFVEPGQHVETDTVVGIVETMKLMNSVYAGTRGHIAEICLGDAEFAIQGAVLMRIQPDAP
jgi:acetyl-CoA carboxylase biotin carboxyl carrier protein